MFEIILEILANTTGVSVVGQKALGLIGVKVEENNPLAIVIGCVVWVSLFGGAVVFVIWIFST